MRTCFFLIVFLLVCSKGLHAQLTSDRVVPSNVITGTLATSSGMVYRTGTNSISTKSGLTTPSASDITMGSIRVRGASRRISNITGNTPFQLEATGSGGSIEFMANSAVRMSMNSSALDLDIPLLLHNSGSSTNGALWYTSDAFQGRRAGVTSPFLQQIDILTGTASPSGSQTPDFVGQVFVDTTAGNTYMSIGLTDTDWVQTN